MAVDDVSFYGSQGRVFCFPLLDLTVVWPVLLNLYGITWCRIASSDTLVLRLLVVVVAFVLGDERK